MRVRVRARARARVRVRDEEHPIHWILQMVASNFDIESVHARAFLVKRLVVCFAEVEDESRTQDAWREAGKGECDLDP